MGQFTWSTVVCKAPFSSFLSIQINQPMLLVMLLSSLKIICTNVPQLPMLPMCQLWYRMNGTQRLFVLLLWTYECRPQYCLKLWKHPHEISKTTKCITMKFLPLVGTNMEAQNQKNFWHFLAWSVDYRPISRKSRHLEMQVLGMLISRNLAGLSILTSEMISENFRSISHRLAILQNNL